MALHSKRVLYFINGPVPTQEQIEEAEGIRGKVSFRNATCVTPEEALEKCDAVAGLVPHGYKKLPFVGNEVEKVGEKQPKAQKETKATKQPDIKVETDWKPGN